MERSDPEARVENTWACLAASGNYGILSSAVCVDVIVALSGRRTCMPFVVGWTFTMGMSTWI